MTSTESLAGLIARRDELKLKVDMHRRAAPSRDAAGDVHRDELSTVIGAITEVLHGPYRVETDRLAQKRQDIVQELEQAQHQRTAVRNALVTAQAARTATLGCGDDPGEHVTTADELSGELEDVERTIGELAHRVQGLDAQHVALVEAEGVNIVSGISAS